MGAYFNITYNIKSNLKVKHFYCMNKLAYFIMRKRKKLKNDNLSSFLVLIVTNCNDFSQNPKVFQKNAVIHDTKGKK